MRLLFVASDSMEFRGLLRRCTQVHHLSLSADWSRTALLGDYEIAMAANGAGPQRARAAADAAIAKFAPDAVASVGFCGALEATMRIGDVIVGDTVLSGDRRHPCVRPGQSANAQLGTVCSIDYVARTASEKSRLHATGAIAVEMEAAGVAESAEAAGRPFFCIKAVTDLAEETMANDFNAALRSDGHFDTMKVLASSLRHPWVRLPELVRLGSRCLLAARSMGDFIADCRF